MIVLDDTIFFKTILCTIEDEGPIVCKFHFQKIEGEEYSMIENGIEKIKNTFTLYKHPNVMVYDKVQNIAKKSMVGIRQYVCSNLNERLHRIPELLMIEKKWITFQLLCAVSQIHSEKMVHGDIKRENILITSYNWVFISDMVPYKPAFLRYDDLKTYNSYFGELNNNQRCYIAPERFKIDWDDSFKDVKLLEPSMDIFSLGCVIAEIFMNGHPLFGLAQLQSYWKGTYDPAEELQKKIKDQQIIDMILSMIDKEPSNRLTINEYIIKWNQGIFPRSFSQVFYQLNAAILRPQFQFSDSKVAILKKFINSIWFACFGKKNAVVSEEFNEPIEIETFEQLREDLMNQQQSYLVPSNELFVFLNHQLLESSMEMRLEFILPYAIQMFEDENSKVKGKAIEVTVKMFSDILEDPSVHQISEKANNIFQIYILPAFRKLKGVWQKDNEDKYVQYIFVRYLPMLAQIGQNFLEISIGNKLQKRKRQGKSGQDKNSMNNTQEEEEEEKWEISGESILQSSQSLRGRGTIIIRDDFSNLESMKVQDTLEVFLNYDTEYDKLRRTILSIINDILSGAEHASQRILFQELGRLSVFLGRKMSIDNLIPLLNSCFNKKDFMLRRECLIGIPYLGLTVGSQTLARYLLITCTQLLYDSEESVVFEMVKSMKKLLEFHLISKKDTFEYLDKILPFLMHPNTWIREEVISYIKFLANPANQLLTQAEAYCLLRPKLKKYLKKGEKVYQIHGDDLSLSKLKPALSRDVFEKQIQDIALPQAIKQANIEQLKLQEDDQFALGILQEVLENAKVYYQSFKRDKLQKDIENEYYQHFQKQFERAKVYRLITTTTMNQLAGLQIQSVPSYKKRLTLDFNDSQIQGGTQLTNDQISTIMESEKSIRGLNGVEDLDEKFTATQYCDEFYYPQERIVKEDLEILNYGLNQRTLNNTYPMNFELDFIFQALNVVPQDPEIPLVNYKNVHKFSNISNQSLVINSNLYIEASSEQPQSLPQFHEGSKKIPIQVQFNQTTSSLYLLGNPRTKLHNWRPTGRLVTTLYEHNGPVNTLAITDDNQFFLTGSQSDKSINIWSTAQIESDVTSHSLFSLKTSKPVNAITTLNNSNYFAVAGNRGKVDIYQVGRLEQEQAANIKNNTSVFRNATIDKNIDINYTSVLKTIEKKDQGDITHITNMVLPISQSHLLGYVSQRGSFYLYDLRVRYDAIEQNDLLGCQRGMVTSMSLGQDPYQIYFGTLGGYVMIYDVRYNVISQYYKHFQRAAINSVQPFCPSKQSALNLYGVDDNTHPLALIATGSQNYEVSLIDLATSDVKIFLTVDDSKQKDNIAACTPIVPSFYKENMTETIDNSFNRKYETNSTLYRRYLQTHKNSRLFGSIINSQQQQIIKNLDEEWLKNSNNRCKLVTQSYESSSACKQILIPRKYNNVLFNSDTVNYAITGGNDRRIRYWDFLSLQKKSYYVNTPQDDECQYYAENLGSTYTVQEKINQFKQFPQVNSHMAQQQFNGVVPTANVSLVGNNAYYGIMGEILKGQEQIVNDGVGNGGNDLRSMSYQYDTQGEQTIIYNFNGLSEWQHFNGLSVNSGQGSYGQEDLVLFNDFKNYLNDQRQLSNASSGGIDFLYRESESVSHTDCILDMGIVETSLQDPILITCGRDHKIKLWR